MHQSARQRPKLHENDRNCSMRFEALLELQNAELDGSCWAFGPLLADFDYWGGRPRGCSIP
eukprot:7126224-Alexandrium_andersonii.AAC.1